MPIDWSPLTLSLRVALCAPPRFRWWLGLAIAYLLANRSFRGRDLLDAVVTLPLVLPPTVLGYYLLVLLGNRGPDRAGVCGGVRGSAGVHVAGGGDCIDCSCNSAVGEVLAGGA